jgi:hypothetical protein
MGPYSVFALGSGYAFSHAFDHIAKVLAVGTACVFIGAWCGANIAFVLGRFCCRKRVLKFAEKKPILRAIDKVVLKEGLKLIILMRMSLLIPFNFSNYIFGCSAIKYWQFALGTLGVLPLVCPCQSESSSDGQGGTASSFIDSDKKNDIEANDITFPRDDTLSLQHNTNNSACDVSIDPNAPNKPDFNFLANHRLSIN